MNKESDVNNKEALPEICAEASSKKTGEDDNDGGKNVKESRKEEHEQEEVDENKPKDIAVLPEPASSPAAPPSPKPSDEKALPKSPIEEELHDNHQDQSDKEKVLINFRPPALKSEYLKCIFNIILINLHTYILQTYVADLYSSHNIQNKTRYSKRLTFLVFLHLWIIWFIE